VTRLQEENRDYKDKIRYLERTIALMKPTVQADAPSSLTMASSSSSEFGSFLSEVGSLGRTNALRANIRGIIYVNMLDIELMDHTEHPYASRSLALPLVPSASISTPDTWRREITVPNSLPTNPAHGYVGISVDPGNPVTPQHQLIGSQYTNILPLYDLSEPLHPGNIELAQHHPPEENRADTFIPSSIPQEMVPIIFPVFSATTDPLSIARYYFFANGIIFGLRFTSAKTQAWINGDLSNTIIRSASVHASNLWGLTLLARSQGSQLDDAVQATHYSAACASLRIPTTTRESIADDIQARVVLAIYDFDKRNFVAGRTLLREAVWSIRQAGLEFTLPSRTSGIRNDATLYVAATAKDHERDALCHLVSVDIGARMILNVESALDASMQLSIAQLLVSVFLSCHSLPSDFYHSHTATNILMMPQSWCSV
jgi:hypothetical protein